MGDLWARADAARERSGWSIWCRKGQPEKCRRLDAACTNRHSRPTPLRPPQVQPVVVEDIPVPIAGVDGYVGCDTFCNCDDEPEPIPAATPPRRQTTLTTRDQWKAYLELLLVTSSSPWWRNPYIGLFCRERPITRCRLCVSPGCNCGCHA